MIQKLARYWATDYDWRNCEAKLNALPQFITEIDGLDIHFIHVRSRHDDALPLIVSHGWPGSIIEQLKIIDRLTDPTAHGGSAADAFHVVIPSMPGYGFSGKPTEHWLGPRAHGPRLGRADEPPWLRPLRRPGRRLGCVRRRPDGLAGTRWIARHPHQHACRPFPADVNEAALAGDPPPAGLSAEERRAYEQLIRTFKQVEYARMMAARPQTLYGIADLPVGLAAWLLDHNDADGQPAAAVVAALDRTTSATGELTRDEILDNITLYWLTNTGVSASRLYWEYKGGFFNAKGVAISRRDDGLSRRAVPGAAQLGGAGIPQSHLLQPGRPGRPLRRLGTASAVQRGAPGRVPLDCGSRQVVTGTTVVTRTHRSTEMPHVATASNPTSVDDGAIRPFHVEVPQAAIDDLRRRLLATRWPEKETVSDSSQGVPLATMRELVRYWATDYDFRPVGDEAERLPQFLTEIDGLDIHFIHVTSPHADALPADHHPRLAGVGHRDAERGRPARPTRRRTAAMRRTRSTS